jgi:hypothetical protein
LKSFRIASWASSETLQTASPTKIARYPQSIAPNTVEHTHVGFTARNDHGVATILLKQGAEAPAIPRRVYGLVDDLSGRAEGIEFRNQVDKAATFFLQRELAPSDVILPPEVLAFTRSPCRMKRVKTVDGGRASHNLTMLGRTRGIHSKPHSEPGANSSCISTQM